MPSAIYVQYGAGLQAPAGWQNFDASPSVRAQRAPLLGPLARRLGPPFSREVRFGDIVRGLPVADGAAAGVYASHVLEHLPLEDFRVALRNTMRMLRSGGVFRLVVPDLAERAARYTAALAHRDARASVDFMHACHLGRVARSRSPMGFLRDLIGNGAHLWMWDEFSMARELAEAGFIAVRRCAFGDAEDPMFASAEDRSRFVDGGYDPPMRELAMEARKT